MKFIKDLEKILLLHQKALLIKFSDEPASNCLLSSKNLAIILEKIPYTLKTMEHHLDLSNVSEKQKEYLPKIVRIIEGFSFGETGNNVFFKDNTFLEATVLQGGSKYVVNLKTFNCSCVYNDYSSDSCSITGMCSHLAKTITSSKNQAIQKRFSKPMGLIRRHAFSNTEAPIPRLPHIHSFEALDKMLDFYDSGRFVYVTYEGNCDSYYLPGMKWCENISPGIPVHILETAEQWILDKYDIRPSVFSDIVTTNIDQLNKTLRTGKGSFEFHGESFFNKRVLRISAIHYDLYKDQIKCKAEAEEASSERKTIYGTYFRDANILKLAKCYQERYSQIILSWIIKNDDVFIDTICEVNELFEKGILIKPKIKHKKSTKPRISKTTLIDGPIVFGITNKRGDQYYYLKLRQDENGKISEIKRQKKVVSNAIPMKWLMEKHLELKSIMDASSAEVENYFFPWDIFEIKRVLNQKSK